ncbi:hypothetical protein HYV70_05625 [Candidatus Uhrbacteria bacterium]|nr:hypothetical protein [Candidatus Uhrbacteria bacterium]
MPDYIHHDPDRILYSLSEDELENLSNQAQSLWKDVCLVSFSVGIPTVINAIAELSNQETFQITITIFLNILIGIMGIALGIVFAIAWHRSHKSIKNVMDNIKARPKIELNPTTSNVGALEDLRGELKKIANQPARWG